MRAAPSPGAVVARAAEVPSLSRWLPSRSPPRRSYPKRRPRAPRAADAPASEPAPAPAPALVDTPASARDLDPPAPARRLRVPPAAAPWAPSSPEAVQPDKRRRASPGAHLPGHQRGLGAAADRHCGRAPLPARPGRPARRRPGHARRRSSPLPPPCPPPAPRSPSSAPAAPARPAAPPRSPRPTPRARPCRERRLTGQRRRGGDVKELLKGRTSGSWAPPYGPEADAGRQHGRDGGLVVIDTAGVTPRDPAGVEALGGELAPCRSTPCISRSRRRSAPRGPRAARGLRRARRGRVAVTHADEADQLGIAAELAHISGLPVAYIHEGLDLDGALSAADPSCSAGLRPAP